MAKKVTVIQAFPDRTSTQMIGKLRVCAYARVSTDSQEQATSYIAQVKYYTDKIESNPLWEFAGVYADEGISGRKKKGRDDFEAMLQDCEEGHIDLILTKSIARFARNTIECIQTIRRLKEISVGVFFEKENINTLDESSELVLTILASVAQAESEDFASNNRWGVISRFENGTFIISEPAFGYSKDAKGQLIINEEEAKIIRWIFTSYLNGMGAYTIATELNNQKVPTIRNAKRWKENEVRVILKNPIYEGNLLFQKTYTETQYPFTKKWNKGELAMYLIEDSHPQIVTHKEAKAVRDLMESRKWMLHITGENSNNRYAFTGRIVCGDCGKHLRRKKIYIGQPKERIVWECKTHVADKDECRMEVIREEVIKRAFVNMWNKLYTNQGTVLEPLLKALNELKADKTDYIEIEKLNNELEKLGEQSQILNQVMMKGYMDPALFMEKNSLLMYEVQKCRKKRMQLIRKQKNEKEITRTEALIEMIKEEGYQTCFQEKLFQWIVKDIRVSINHEISFCLLNGLILTEPEGGAEDVMAYSDWL